MSVEITGGEVSDYKGYDLVMDAEVPDPKVFLADRGYDADSIRDDIEARGGTSIIPGRKNRKTDIPVDGYIYALRNRIERCFNKLKKLTAPGNAIRQNCRQLSRLHTHQRPTPIGQILCQQVLGAENCG